MSQTLSPRASAPARSRPAGWLAAALAVSCGLVAASLATPAVGAEGIKWQEVEQALGHKGEVTEGLFKATSPRTDLNVRLFFLHFWGTGDPTELAAGLKGALARTNVVR